MSQINQIKATPDGRYLVVGFPEASKVCFFSINAEEINLAFLEPKITVEFDSFECDDALGVIIFNNLKAKTLTLYAVQWLFDDEKLDINQLKKMDEARLGLDAPEQLQLEDDKEANEFGRNSAKDNQFP